MSGATHKSPKPPNENPAAFQRGGVPYCAQLVRIERLNSKATKVELQRTAKALHFEALSLSGGSRFAALALSAHFGRRSAVPS